MGLLVPDIYTRLCEHLGCALPPDHIELSSEIDKSLTLVGLNRRAARVQQSEEDVDKKIRSRARGQSFAELILTPVQQKERQHSDFLNALTPELAFGSSQ
jgi:Rieske Fe-S protein